MAAACIICGVDQVMIHLVKKECCAIISPHALMTERTKSLRLRAMTSSHAAQISLWLKVLHTLLVGVVVVVYAIKYKPTNFLWFSDIALVTSVPAMWLENSLLASTMAVAVLLPELAWNVDFFSRHLFGWRGLGLSDSMFESRRPPYLRALSLFHLALPILLIWLVHRLGYDRRALLAQTVMGLGGLTASYFLTKTHDKINLG